LVGAATATWDRKVAGEPIQMGSTNVGLAFGKAQQAIRLGALSIDLDRFVIAVRGAPVKLTRVEFDLLETLARRFGQVVSYPELAERALRAHLVGESAALRVHLTHIRRKLGPSGRAIVTVRGRGLLFDPDRL
jgi:DNA-binding response OmpR family regulator